MTKQEPTVVMDDLAGKRGFAMIPNEVIRDPRLTAQSKALYTLMRSYAWGNKEDMFTGKTRMAAEMNWSTRYLSTIMDELKACGLVIVKLRGRNITNQYRLTDRVNPDWTIVRRGGR